MTQEDKNLLLNDLCARLPYKVKINVPHYYEDEDGIITLDAFWLYDIQTGRKEIKPYLRPMSSMTDEELFEVQDIIGKGVEIRDIFISIVDSSINSFTYLELQAVFKWLFKNHFDFMGLIPKDLAIEVTEDNNPYKE